MTLDDILRQVKRMFGDEYGILINDQDIFDWAYNCQIDIIRDTSDNDTIAERVANTFPVQLTDKVLIKRVATGNRAVVETTLDELDAVQFEQTQEGTPKYWYREGNYLKLWPQPKSTDTSVYSISYSKMPNKLTLVAPWLKFSFNQAATQYASFTADPDFQNTGANFYLDWVVDSPVSDAILVARGNAHVAASMAWVLTYQGATLGNGKYVWYYSNGTTIRTATLTDPTPIVAGETKNIRIRYVASTGVTTFFSVSSSGVETQLDQNTQGVFNIATTSYPITFNKMGGGADGIVGGGDWRLKGFKYTNDVNYTITILEFNGDPDLTRLPTIPATPFLTTQGQTMTVVGNPQVYSPDNVLSVPEVWHPDIVRYCIARAHEKNRDNRNYEQAMKEFDQKVSTRRNEQDGTDGPHYKMADPFDYDWSTDTYA